MASGDESMPVFLHTPETEVLPVSPADEAAVPAKEPSLQEDETPDNKRRRVAAEETPHPAPPLLNKRESSGAACDFYIRFAQSLTFRTWLDVIACVLQECHFAVVRDGSFEGLSIESIDHTKICMVQARLSASDLELPYGPRSFCIRTANLVSSLRGATPQQFVDMWSLKDSGELKVAAFEPNVSSFSQQNTIRTIDNCDDVGAGLESLRYEMYVEIDLSCFRAAVKAAKDHKVQTMQLGVYIPRKDEAAQGTSRVTTFFVMCYKGDEVSGHFVHQSCSEPTGDELGTTAIRATDGTACEFATPPAEDELKCLFKERYLVEYLMHFVKSMERHTITLRLAAGLPLLLEYPFGGGSENFIRFILAPFNEN